MRIDYNVEKLKQALSCFYEATGVNIQFFTDDFTPLRLNPQKHNHYCKSVQSCEAGKTACRLSDIALLEKAKQSKRAEFHVCHAGLMDIAIPLLYENTVLGYIILGQMKKELDFSFVCEKIQRFSLDPTQMQEQYATLYLYDENKIQSVANVAIMLTKYILLEDMIKITPNRYLERVVAFIDENLSEELSVQRIAKSVNVSKSALYKLFHAYFHCTVSGYINKKRIEKSALLLVSTDLSIEEISGAVGYANASYYAKTFKKEKGVSPLQFRKRHADTGF